jgi:hypothetical protein
MFNVRCTHLYTNKKKCMSIEFSGECNIYLCTIQKIIGVVIYHREGYISRNKGYIIFNLLKISCLRSKKST